MPKATKTWVCAVPLEELEHKYQSLYEQDTQVLGKINAF